MVGRYEALQGSDTDGDLTPDYLDTDSDGDTVLDQDELGSETDILDLQDTDADEIANRLDNCLLYTSPSPRDKRQSRMPSSA